MNEYLGEIKQAYDLSKQKDKAINSVDTIEREEYSEPSPQEPRKNVAQYQPPETPKSSLTFDWKEKIIIIAASFALSMICAIIAGMTHGIIIVSGLCNMLGVILACVSWFYFIYALYLRLSKFPKQKKADVERLMKTPEYLAEVDRRKAIQADQQKQFDAQYDSDMTKYKADLALYKAEKAKWEDDRTKRLSDAKDVLTAITGKFNVSCDAVGSLPYNYRNTDALAYIFGVLESSSDMTVKEAIESYDRKLSRDLEEQRLQEARYQSRLQEEHNEEVARQTELQEEYNDIAERSAKQQNVWNAIHTLQSHKQNKILSQMNKRAEDAKKRRDRHRYR